MPGAGEGILQTIGAVTFGYWGLLPLGVGLYLLVRALGREVLPFLFLPAIWLSPLASFAFLGSTVSGPLRSFYPFAAKLALAHTLLFLPVLLVACLVLFFCTSRPQAIGWSLLNLVFGFRMMLQMGSYA